MSEPTKVPMILGSSALGDVPEVVHGFCGRRGGVSPPPFDTLNLDSGVGDDPANVMSNLERIAAEVGVSADRFVFMEQVHGTDVRVVHERDLQRFGDARPKADALVTDRPGMILCIDTADCLPILIHESKKRVIAAVHAGWRGISGGIVQAVFEELVKSFGASPKRMTVAMGPYIRSCCYRVGSDVAWAYRDFRTDHDVLATSRNGNAWALDMAAAVRVILKRLGVPRGRIESLDRCTSCERDNFFSHRRDGAPTGRMVNFIGLL